MSLPVVALLGRPNVGKSALFNRVIGQGAAIVSDEPGTTRDRHFARAEWNGQAFWLVDTGGLVEDSAVPMDVEIRKQVHQAIDEADLMLLMVDARVGVHPSDARIVDMLRDRGKPFVLVANKVDDPSSTDFYEFYRLGAGDPVPVSAGNGKGSGDLLDVIVERLPERDEPEEEALRVAVIGRPNVGKSSFVNRLLGEERLVVSEVAGTTRDAIDTPTRYHGRDLVFVDTAGLRRQSKVDDGIEFYSSLRTRRAIEGADVCVLLIDAVLGLENQDLKIATLAWEAGRGLIVVVNKWDLKEKDDKTAAKFQKAAVEKAPYLAWVPFLFTSALTGQRVPKIMDVLLQVADERVKRITTSQVNDTLEALVQRTQPPQTANHHEVRLNYATQVETAPPVIAVFSNHPDAVPVHYVRYLHNGFRAEYGFIGNPLEIVLRQKNAPATDHRRVRGERRRMIETSADDVERPARALTMTAAAALGLVVAYLLGSIPTAYLAGRLRGVDLRRHGSGNLGATNALRVLGWRTGLPVFAVDALKGFVPAKFFAAWLGVHPHWALAYGLAAIAGHVKPVYLIGRGGGGKGVATAAGVFLGLAPVATLIAFAVFGAVVAASGYVSLGSIAASVAFVVALGVIGGTRSALFPVGVVVAAFVIWSHRANIGRLRRGEESSFRRRGAPRGTAT